MRTRLITAGLISVLICLLGYSPGAAQTQTPQQSQQTAALAWFSFADLQAELELTKSLYSYEFTYPELQQFFQIWQRFKVDTGLAEPTNAKLAMMVLQEAFKAKNEDQLKGLLEKLQPSLEQLKQSYQDNLKTAVAATRQLLGERRWARLKVKDTIFDWPYGVIRISRKIYAENPEYYPKFVEDIISGLADASHTGGVFPVTKAREWINNVAQMPPDELEARRMELYKQFVGWMIPPEQVEASLKDLRETDHASKYIEKTLINPFTGSVLMGRLRALAPKAGQQ